MNLRGVSGYDMGTRTMTYLGIMISIICLLFFVNTPPAPAANEVPEPAYKGLRPQKEPFDPDRLPDPFLSYLIRRGQLATQKAQEEKERQLAAEEQLKKEKQAAADKLKELLVAKTDLQKLSLSQLTVTAIVQSDAGAWAMVRDPTGRGFVVKKGTLIGTNGGIVDRIVRREKKIIIKEPYLEDEIHIRYKDVDIKLPDQVYE